MKTKQIQNYVMRYLEATECHVVEKTPAHVTVKLSPEADKDLTGRHYYWSFVERTGAEPQTMTFTFVFDPEKMKEQEAKQQQKKSPQSQTASPAPATDAKDSILGHYFGVSAPTTISTYGRIPRDELTYGSRRLEQIFGVAKSRGKFVQLYEHRKQSARGAAPSVPYTTWLGVNYKVELCCDMKRGEIHSLGINLMTGAIVDSFYEQMADRTLTPKLPVNTFLSRPSIPLTKAMVQLEEHLYKKLEPYDHKWAAEAQERLEDEQARIRSFYQELLQNADEETKPAVEQQFEQRLQEIEWQYKPRIEISAINCGVYHLEGNSL
ncbi:YqhG family protein [Paenibacillus turpanensis]|uniref:YqhG family protein n=1 Tax=Paenibacillus turpanensis TaxID=2689078 RepID=UPI00140B2F7A|nr:YqhG family protein [Paenibacillus turpanensis]